MRTAITGMTILAGLFLSSFLHHLTTHVAGVSPPPPYVPLENIALDCGSSDDTVLDGRNWSADTNSSKYSLLHHQNQPSMISKALKPATQVQSVPYTTARLSHSEFTYTFSVKRGPKFIRLHFFPSSYPGFNTPYTFFSVKANRYTLLSNFSAAYHADALRGDGFKIEFCLFVQNGENLSLTFTPSPDMPDSYAFINGIEIVSMPANLYYSAADESFNLVNNVSTFSIDSNTALELMYRINVAGNFISPKDDTGMFRSWELDDTYLTDFRPSALQYNKTLPLKYDNLTQFAAPDDVYRTARTMGPNKTVNENYYLTWEFSVDTMFSYFVRLHFCDFIPIIRAIGDRIFEIYIDDYAADLAADVMSWTNGVSGVPVYKDYAVMMYAKGGKMVRNLSIKLHPAAERLTGYSDSLLNGIEVFKLSKFSLAGPNPDPAPINPTTPTIPRSTKPKNNNKSTMITIVVGSVLGSVALCLLLFLIFRRRRLKQVKDSDSTEGGSKWTQISSSTKSGKTPRAYLPSDLCRHFSLAEIKAATNNFDDVFIIGEGGFGKVYKGFIDGGSITVAIKRLNPESRQGAMEFKTEIEMLSQLRYLHLVSLIGYCNENHEMILVYDYMSHGTLRDHLYNTDNPPLSWTQRLEICIGSARGLQYLHTGAKHTIIHRDVKTTNILLDEKWVAKFSDFGLSKIGPTSLSKPHISTVVKGSIGYLDPEYMQRQQLTDKSDVYSFGVVLWEVLCARPPVIRSAMPVSLAELARQSYLKGTINDIIDPYIKEHISQDCLNKFVEVAMSCLLDNGMERPSMTDVVWGLEFALQLQESAEEHVKFGGAQTEMEADMESTLKGSSIDDSSDAFSTSSGLVIGSRVSAMTFTSSSGEQSSLTDHSERMTSGAVFSEIMNPKAR